MQNYPQPHEVRPRRKKLGLTQRELAEAARLRPATVCEIESGKVDPHTETLMAIGAALDRLAPRKGKKR